MPFDKLRHNASIVDALADSLVAGEHGLSVIPGLVKRVITEECWREREVRQTKQQARFERFADFIAAYPPEGLHTDVKTLLRLCADDKEAVALIDEATQGPPSLHRAGNNIPGRPEGTTAQKAIRRLRKDRPDLHAQVLAGALSPHAAAVAAGFRRRTITVPLEPEAAARTLRRHLGPDELRTLLSALQREVE